MGKRMLSLCMALALCLGLLPATALAAEGDWEHTSHGADWTALTTDKLSGLNYSLTTGKYYLSGVKEDQNAPFSNMSETNQITVAAGEKVTLCINDVVYDYNGSEDFAIIVEAGASLTICCCGSIQYAGLNSNDSCAVKNNGTLNMASGRIFSRVECGAAIYNAGTCIISGGKVSGSAGGGYQEPYETAYGIYNEEGGNLTITGSPEISGQAPGELLEPTGPKIDVHTSDTITVHDLSAKFEGINIGFYGEDGDTVVSGVTDENTAELFTVTDPENSKLIYDSASGELTFDEGEVIDYGSLYFAGEPVVNQTKYKIKNTEDTTFSATLEEVEDAESEDYDLLWDEDTMTLTLNSATVKASCKYTSGSSDKEDALISLNCNTEKTLNVKVIGKNHLTALNPFTGWNSGFEESRVIENRNGGIAFTGDGSLTVEVVADKYTYEEGSGFNVESMTAIYATGAVENQTNLTVTGTDEDKICQSMTGIACASFTNTGAFTADISDAYSACAVDASGAFANAAGASFTATISATREGSNGTGVACQTFENNGTMDIDINGDSGAMGIANNDDAGNWTNNGTLTIDVGVDGAPAGSLVIGNLSRLAGICWNSDNQYSFTNSGTMTVTAKSEQASTQSKDNWPTWQFFDTIAVSLMPGEGSTVTNSGTMTLNAHNGYTAGLYVFGDESIALKNTGDLAVTVDTLGGDNIRAVGIYAQISNIEDGQVKELPLQITDGSVEIKAQSASGASDVMDDACMAVCLVQSFKVDSAPTGIPDGLQQIELTGMSLGSGSAVVAGPYAVSEIGGTDPAYISFINTIGTVDADGTVTPSTGMTALPALTGTVTIEGNPQVGDTLTAKVSGLPDGVTVTYQWQSADSQSGPFTAIAGATGESYTLTNNELGKYIQVVVTPVGGQYGGTLTATTSQPVARPYAPPANPNYKITIEDTEHGTVTAPTSAKQGTEVTLTPTPDEGYEVGTVTVTDRFGDAVEVTEHPDGTYTFTMPNGQVTVEVTFVESQPEPLPFTDVAESDWFYDAVRYAYENGLMGGVGDNLFAPNNPTTRAQLVTILYRLEGEPAVTGQSGFTDVEADTWYTDAVIWAAEEGVVNGVSETQFAPGNNITREQLATILFRYAQAKGYDVFPRADLSGFPDAGDILPYAQEAMAWAVAEGLLQGFEDDTLRPQGNATRAQIATILMRFCQTVAE